MGLESYVKNGARWDGDTYSLKYFNVSRNFTVLKKGKNTITLSPDPIIVAGSSISVELLDRSGKSIPVEYSNQITSGGSIILHIDIKDTVAKGTGKLIILGKAYRDVDTGRVLDQSRQNLVWRGLTQINTAVEEFKTPNNPDDIVFEKNPKDISVKITPIDISYRDKSTDRPSTKAGTGKLTYFPIIQSSTTSNNILNKPSVISNINNTSISKVEEQSSATGIGSIISTEGNPTIVSTVAEFISDMVGGTITATPIILDRVPPNLQSQIGSVSEYSGTILEVLNSTTIVVDALFFHNITSSTGKFVVDSFVSDIYSINYNKNVKTSEGQKVTGYAKMCFDNVATSNGVIDKVKVSAKPVGSIGAPMFIGDFDVMPPNKMQDTGSFTFDPKLGIDYKSVGEVTSSNDISNYFDYNEYKLNTNANSNSFDNYNFELASGGLTVPNPVQSSTNVTNAISFESPIAESNVTALSVKDQFLGSAKAGTKYKISLNAYSEYDTTKKKPTAQIFINGPSLEEGGDTSNSFGTLIDTLEGGNGERQDNLEYYFTAASDSEKIKLSLILNTGIWDFSNMKVEPSSPSGNSPKEFCVMIPLDNLPVNKIDEEYVFVVDFIGKNGNPTNLNITTQSITLNSNSTLDEKLLINTINSSATLRGVIIGLGSQGVQGVQGFQGFQGRQGIQGTQGAQGAQGNQGLTGLQGTAGAQGTTGLQGTAGAQGTTGLQGTTGAQGDQGIQGTIGTQGFQGRQGAQGNQGTTGLQGTTGAQGNQGTQGTTGLQGTAGAQGDQGIQGTIGTQGFQGRQGPTGFQGFTGFGLQGMMGAQGNQGPTGLQGTTGAQGSSTDVDVSVANLITRLGQINTSYTAGNSTGVTATFSGNIQTSQFVTADNFITTSDRRLKSDIKELSGSLEVLKKFNSYSYIKNGYKDAGFIAQEVLNAIPYVISEREDGYLTIRDRAIMAYLHSAIIELSNKINCIEDRLK